MSDFDDEPRGRSATGAVVIAVIFLALLGTGVGLVLGSQHKKDDGGNRAAEPSPTATAQPTATGTPKASATTRPPTTGGSYRPTARDKCPQQTEEAAGSTLTVKRYVKTNRSEAWICANGGKLYYQGHVLGASFRGATTDTTIFLNTVAFEGDVYIANNGDTNYLVGKETLRIEKNGNVQSNEDVVDLYEG